MANPKLAVSVSVDDATGRVVAVYFHIREGQAAETRAVLTGKAFADYDESGALLGVELLAPCAVGVLDDIAESEPAPVKRFLKGSAPREMVLA